jgi:hypothetical protein
MDNTIDLLQIKIEKAKAQLSDDTLNAINSVPWKDIIIGMREKNGYTFEQLGDLELETELLLCGLVSPENYPKEIRSRLKISEIQANELVKEMNELIFSRIKEELIKTVERKKMFAKKNSPLEEYPSGEGGQIIHPGASATPQEGNKHDMEVLKAHGIEIIPETARRNSSSPFRGGYEERSSKTPHPDPLLEKERGNTLPVPEKLELKGAVIHPIFAQKLSAPTQTPIVKTEHTLQNLSSINVRETIVKNHLPKVDPYREVPE